MLDLCTEIDVDASPSTVWRVLTDADRFPEWNPMVERLLPLCNGNGDGSGDGEPALRREGAEARVRYRSSVGLPLSFSIRVTRSEPGRELRWVGKSLSVEGDHYFLLAPRGRGRTRLVHGQIFSGPLERLAAPAIRRQRPVFERFNRALKEAAEREAREG